MAFRPIDYTTRLNSLTYDAPYPTLLVVVHLSKIIGQAQLQYVPADIHFKDSSREYGVFAAPILALFCCYSMPHPRALFTLVPYGDDNQRQRARDVIAHPYNSRFLSTLDNGERGLDIGFHIPSHFPSTLATLGRSGADVHIEYSSIAKLQCSFEIHSDTNVVMLYDKSHLETTQVFGENATPFETGRIRQVLVQPGLNVIIGMGGAKRNFVLFELIWLQDPIRTMERVKNREDEIRSSYQVHPLIARTTLDDTETVMHSERETRLHTPGPQQLKIRYLRIGTPLGSGQFGTVHKAINVDSGKLLAVKIIQRPSGVLKLEEWKRSVLFPLKREVEILSRLSHVSRTSLIYIYKLTEVPATHR